VEEALCIGERAGDAEVVVVSAGDERVEAALQRCLAMGADRAIRVETGVADPVSVGLALADVIGPEEPDLVLAGVQSSDSVQAATGTIVAELLGLPCVAVVTKVDWAGSGAATVHRELEGGLIDVVEVDTPALLTIQTGINKPRYANLRAIKQAERMDIPVHRASDGTPCYRVRRMFAPPKAGRAEMLEGSPAEIAARIAEIVRERLSA
jgi:electron transfer flavoprotein beta subunit